MDVQYCPALFSQTSCKSNLHTLSVLLTLYPSPSPHSTILRSVLRLFDLSKMTNDILNKFNAFQSLSHLNSPLPLK